MVAALCAMAWLQRRWISDALSRIAAHLRSRGVGYAITVAVPPVISLGLLLLLLAIGLQAITSEVAFEINATEIRHLDGNVYEVSMKRRLDWPWQPISDNPYSPRRSSLTLFENDRLSGRSHSPHEQIELTGGGDYAHWGNSLFFSTTDNTDPRTNGRRYHGKLDAGIVPRLLRQLAELGTVLVGAALGALVLLRRRSASALWRRTAMHVRSRIVDYAFALTIPTLVAISVFYLLPPTWNGSDSVIWLLWQWHWIPHHPPVYPAFMALANAWFDTAPSILWFATAVQHGATVLATGYVASAFPRRWQILLVSVAATIGAAFGLYAQGLFTEGLATAFLLMFLGAVLRLHRDGPTVPVLTAMALALLAATLTRHANLGLAAVPVAYLGIAWLFSRAAPLRASLRSVLAMIALVGGVA